MPFGFIPDLAFGFVGIPTWRQPLSPPSAGETRSAISAPDLGDNIRIADHVG